MVLRLLPLLALLTSLACAPSGDGTLLASGDWVLDRDASVQVTVPLWRLELKDRVGDEIDGLVKQSSYVIDRHLTESAQLDAEMPAIVGRELKDHSLSLTIDGGAFELLTELPGVDEKRVSGTYLLADGGELVLVRRVVDGVELEQPEKVTARVDDQGRVVLPLGRLFAYVLVREG